jgi:hypothetical protein
LLKLKWRDPVSRQCGRTTLSALERAGGTGGNPSRQSSLAARSSHDRAIDRSCSRSGADFAQSASARQVEALRRYDVDFDE